MSHTFGLLPLPAPADVDPAFRTVGDPCLALVLGFAQAVLNAGASAAWSQLLTSGSRQVPAVKRAFAQEPEDEGFSEDWLPALFLFRGAQGDAEQVAEDWYQTTDRLTLWWVFPAEVMAKRAARHAFVNVVDKVLRAAFFAERDASFAAPGDPDPRAASVAALPDAVKLASATSTSSQTFSGAQLDGAVGPGAVSPPRPVTVSLSGPQASFAPGSLVTVAGLDVVGQAHSWALAVPNAAPPLTLTCPADCTRVVSVTVAAQADALGTVSVGLGAFAGIGSELCDVAGYVRLTPGRATYKALQLRADDQVRRYDMVELLIDLEEQLDRDPSVAPGRPLAGVTVDVVQSPTFTTELQLPDGAG